MRQGSACPPAPSILLCRALGMGKLMLALGMGKLTMAFGIWKVRMAFPREGARDTGNGHLVSPQDIPKCHLQFHLVPSVSGVLSLSPLGWGWHVETLPPPTAALSPLAQVSICHPGGT